MTPDDNAPSGLANTDGATAKRCLRIASTFSGPALVAVLFVLLAVISWRKWPDILIDFGVQLYIPWRINEGAVLYRDLFYMSGGPLSQYFNALLFKIFGVSFSTLIWANLIFAAGLVVFIYRRFRSVSDALTATTICLGLVSGFIFANYTTIGNYNYVAPYTHDTVHGVILSVLIVGLLCDWLVRPRFHLACLAGLGAGLVFLTKPDIFLALMVTTAATLALYLASRHDWRTLAKSTASFVAAFLLPPLFFFLLFLRSEDWQSSLHSVVFGWVPLLGTKVPNNPYYARYSGMDQPIEHLREMCLQFICAAVIIGIYAFVFRRLGRWTSLHSRWRWLAWFALVLPLLVCAWRFEWTNCGASLPFWCATIIAFVGWHLWRVRGQAFSREFTFPLIWTVFALMLMAKMGFLCRVWHYGFALAMPAFSAAVYFLMWLLPRFLEKRYQVPTKYLRATFLTVLLIGFTFLWGFSEHTYSYKRQPIGNGGDQIVTFGPGVDTGDAEKIALDWINQNVPTNATLAVVPTGITLNYLTRRINPTPCLFWDPNLLAVCGQKNMTESFEAHPPDYVLLVGGSHKEWNFAYFGSDPNDGAEVVDWIRKNYRSAVVIGHEPLRDSEFGLEFLKRLPQQASAKVGTPNP